MNNDNQSGHDSVPPPTILTSMSSPIASASAPTPPATTSNNMISNLEDCLGPNEVPLFQYRQWFRNNSSNSNSNQSNDDTTDTTDDRGFAFTCESMTQLLLSPPPEDGTNFSTIGIGNSISNSISNNISNNNDSTDNTNVDIQEEKRNIYQQPQGLLARGTRDGTIIIKGTSCPLFFGQDENMWPLRIQTTTTTTTTTTNRRTSTPKSPPRQEQNDNKNNNNDRTTAATTSSIAIVAVSFDAQGTSLAAIDTTGACCVWDLQYHVVQRRQSQGQGQGQAGDSVPEVSSQSQSETEHNHPGNTRVVQNNNDNRRNNTTTNSGSGGLFSSFMTKLTGLPPNPDIDRPRATQVSGTDETAATAAPTTTTTTTTSNDPPNVATSPSSSVDDEESSRLIWGIQVQIVATYRLTYPSHWKVPTCLQLDPKARSFVTGFEDGKLVLTQYHQHRRAAVGNGGIGSTGGLFSRTNLGMSGGSSSTNTHNPRNDTILYQGTDAIQVITWRAQLLAWADEDGIKLLDLETMTRIAHIDRPVGARPSLYPSIHSRIQPYLCWDTKDTLLIAWGDCLMSMLLTDQPIPEGTTIGVRKTVECQMAWELEGVAMGVSPLDANHVLALVVIPPQEQDDETEKTPQEHHLSIVPEHNELELQIISRLDGSIQYADIVPYEDYAQLSSTFMIPRMEDASERLRYQKWSTPGFNTNKTFDLSLLTGTDQSLSQTFKSSQFPNKSKFIDSHLQWDFKSFAIIDEDEKTNEKEQDKDNDNDDNAGSDTASVDSDEYSFVRKPLSIVDDARLARTVAPNIVISYHSEAILINLSSVDDAIDHALNVQKRPALALKRALQYRRQLRHHSIKDLVEEYLESLLMLGTKSDSTKDLSLRRTSLAIQSMPALLGGSIDLWMKWTSRLESIPGALFLLKPYLPVRDPILPAKYYESVLQHMLKDYHYFCKQENRQTKNLCVSFELQAANHVLDAITAWGPTKGLKGFIRLLQHIHRQNGKSEHFSLQQTEVSLQKRYKQTAAHYLQFPIQSKEDFGLETKSAQYDANDTKDSLYSLQSAMALFTSNITILPFQKEGSSPVSESKDEVQPLEQNDQLYLDVIARLEILQEHYDSALRAFLAIGSCHSPLTRKDLETWAIEIAHRGESAKFESSVRIHGRSYEIALSLIENFHLHRLLLLPDFMGKKNAESGKKLDAPLVLFLKLVGLKRGGDFLLDHCVLPEDSTSDSTAKYQDAQRSETLPMNLIVEALEDIPALLYWYLSLVFNKRAELYTNFSNSAVPSKDVTALHQKHFRLHLKFAGDLKNSENVVSRVDAYGIDKITTPFVRFLEDVLPLGSISPVDTRRELETIRTEALTEKEVEEKHVSSMFALELAFVVEHYGNQSEEEAIVILDLLLEGARSILLGVAFAQRTKKYSSRLWTRLIDYCLSKSEGSADGVLFGLLLEAAALSGANLARLVAKIPPGMVVEGLRPRLVAAVADYRLMVDIHDAACEAAANEEVILKREAVHRSRRGIKFTFSEDITRTRATYNSGNFKQNESNTKDATLSNHFRPRARPNRHTFSTSIPMR